MRALADKRAKFEASRALLQEVLVSNSRLALQHYLQLTAINKVLYTARERRCSVYVKPTCSSVGNSTRRRSTANLREREFS